MNRPWMPLNVADYLRDTSHLRALESGAYLHLIMAYWVSSRLPNDDRQLATIAKLTDREWRACKATLAAFFGVDWSSHKRIDKELAKVAEISSKRRASAMQMHSKRDANAHTLNKETKQERIDAEPSGSHSEEAELFERGKKVLGKDSGGLIAKLLKSKKEVPLARAAIEMAATKQNPREYIGRVLSGPARAGAALMENGQPYPDGII